MSVPPINQTARLARAAQGMSNGLWEWNATTGQVWLCPVFEQLLGARASGERRALSTLTSRLHPDDESKFVDALTASATADTQLDESFRLNLPEDGYRWFRARGVVSKNEDGGALVSGGIQDFHAHRMAAEAVREKEQQLIQRQRMEAIDCLAGGIAHEFNNVLHAVCGYISFARAELDPESRPHEDLSQALTAADRAAKLTRDLLNFARAEEVDDEEVELNEVIDGLVELLRPIIGEDIEVRRRRFPGPIVAGVNLLELRQALLNLCINARDAMTTGGVLCISADPFRIGPTHDGLVGSLPAGDYCRLTVTDTGAGIEQEVQSRIFEPFFTTKGDTGGTGLGLAAVYGFVQRSGGHLSVYSEGAGKGSTFSLYLPVLQRGEPMHQRLDDSSPTGDPPTILFVEDDPLVRQLGQRMLTEAGCRVLCAVDGAAALETYIEHAEDISLVLLDVVLPRVSGREVFEQIRRLQSTVPIVFCTGYDPGSVQGVSLHQAGDGVLAKPFDLGSLLNTIRPLLEQAAAV